MDELLSSDAETENPGTDNGEENPDAADPQEQNDSVDPHQAEDGQAVDGVTEDKEIDPNAKTPTVKTTSKAAWLRRMTPALKWAVSAKAPEPAAPWRAATTSLAPRENCKNIRTKTAALAPRKPRKNRLPKGQARKAPCRETLD